MTPLSMEPCLYLTGLLITKVNRQAIDQAYVVARNVAIKVNISKSLWVVLSKPGVSIRTTCRPSIVNSPASCTSVVHEFKCLPMRRPEPLAVLMN